MFIVEVGAAYTTLLAIVGPVHRRPQTSGGSAVPGRSPGPSPSGSGSPSSSRTSPSPSPRAAARHRPRRLRKTRTSTTAQRVVVVRRDVRRSGRARLLGVGLVGRPHARRHRRRGRRRADPRRRRHRLGHRLVDESAITGESAPVIRESGGDRSAVTGGTRVLSDRIVVRITSKPGETFVDRMIRLVEGAARQKTPNEIALNILLASLSIVFVVVTLTLNPIASYSDASVSVPVLIALLVCLIPTTIGALLQRHRHRGHGPPRAAQRARDVGPRRRGRRRRHDAAARQDRHHHVRQPSGRRVHRAARACPRPN